MRIFKGDKYVNAFGLLGTVLAENKVRSLMQKEALKPAFEGRIHASHIAAKLDQDSEPARVPRGLPSNSRLAPAALVATSVLASYPPQDGLPFSRLCCRTATVGLLRRIYEDIQFFVTWAKNSIKSKI